jgi:hypothetical protein
MTATSQQLQQWLNAKENEHLEFKEAKANFHFEKLVKYCAALANEGGGSIVLGVTDKPPRRVVGNAAFADLERTKAGLIDRLKIRIEAQEIAHPDGRVLVFTAPSRPIGIPLKIRPDIGITHARAAIFMALGAPEGMTVRSPVPSPHRDRQPRRLSARDYYLGKKDHHKRFNHGKHGKTRKKKS